jgi:TRAP-type C4-dicarboxylate transport system permease small subunit
MTEAAASLSTPAASPRPLVRAVLAVDRATTTLATALAVLALAVAVAAGFWQVVSRFATSTPATWSEALVRAALIWMTMLGLAVTIRTGALIAIDLAHRLAPAPLKRGMELASLVSVLVLMGTLFWFGWGMTERVRFQNLAGLEISIAYAYAAIPVGAAFAAIGAVAAFLDRREAALATQI